MIQFDADNFKIIRVLSLIGIYIIIIQFDVIIHVLRLFGM
jgi:hypothetical protein